MGNFVTLKLSVSGWTWISQKPIISCLEYIVVHEMTHLLERNQSQQSFCSTYESLLHNWKEIKEELNRLPRAILEWGIRTTIESYFTRRA
jgi:hypothetical protein